MENDKTQCDNAILQDIRSKPIAYTLQVLGLLVILFNLWIASKLAPIAQDITVIQTRIAAMEYSVSQSSTDHDDIQVIKEQVIGLRRDVSDIKDYQKQILTKLSK
jgi:hypothetical protein